MKKIISALFIASGFCACTDNSNNTTSVTGTDTTAAGAITDMNPDRLYVPADGDAMLKDGRVMIWKNGNWVAAEGDVTLGNGVVVDKSGVVKQENRTVQLGEGETVTKTGNFFDRAGHAISDGWAATKRGVDTALNTTGRVLEDAGHAIKKGAQKVGEKTKEVVNDIKKP